MLEVHYRSVLVGSETKRCNQLLHLKPSSHGPSDASIVVDEGAHTHLTTVTPVPSV
jgi:hypothetical protein